MTSWPFCRAGHAGLPAALSTAVLLVQNLARRQWISMEQLEEVQHREIS